MGDEITDDALYDMSDEELEAAFNAAKAGVEEVDDAVDSEDEDLGSDEELDDGVEEVEDEEELDTEDEEVDEDAEAEQPEDDEDSDEDAGEDDEEEDDEESDEDLDEGEEDTPDEDEAEAEEEKPDQAPVKRVYKANGTEFEFTDEEALEQFGKVFGQAANYTQKMQAIAEWRPVLSALKDNGMSQDDVNLMIDVMKGDKDAIAAVVKKAGIDVMDLETEGEQVYVPKNYGKSEQELAIDDVISTIEKDQEFAVTSHVVDRQWDSGSRKALAENPQMIAGLHNDVKSGVYDKVSPMAMKLKVLDGGSKSDLEYYIEAGAQYYQGIEAQKADESAREEAQAKAAADAQKEQERIAAVKQKKATTTVVKKAANKRKAAAPTKKAAGKKDVVDYLDDSDEAFDDWYKKLQDRM